jgi:hypothetical protein
VKLFQCSVEELHPRRRLWPLAKCLFATILLYLPQLSSTYPTHGVLSVLVEKASECDLTMAKLLQWSVHVRNKFDSDNMEASHLEGEKLIPVLFERIITLERIVKNGHEVI